MTRPTNAERLVRIETKLEEFEGAFERHSQAIADNGKSAEAVMDMMVEHVGETRAHRDEIKDLIRAMDGKLTERIGETEKKAATIEARIGMAVVGLGAVILLFWSLTTNTIKGFFEGGGV
jgi:CHASE3 domain sensor protein